MTATVSKIKLRADQIKYTGPEPEWNTQPSTDDDESSRRIAIGRAFDWYNYHLGRSEAKDFVLEYLNNAERKTEADAYKRGPDNIYLTTYGWLARMATKGLELTEKENSRLEDHISECVEAAQEEQQQNPAEKKAPVLSVQDRMRIKMSQAMGEIEGMLDEFADTGYKDVPEFLGVFESYESPAPMSPMVIDEWTQRREEYQTAIDQADPDVVEAYSHLGKIQLRNLVKFADAVIAGINSYAQSKKVARKPRKKKPVSPEKITQKFKYLKKHEPLKIESIAVTKLVECSEAYLYDIKKRKLIQVVADSHLKTFTVKNNSIVGFDPVKTVQKTLRKPEEQLKEFMKASVPNARKIFKDIKSVEIKFTGRGNENLVLLRAK